jgi:bacterial/archaeal transporter family-2 protein
MGSGTLAILITIFAGVCIAIQSALNNVLTKHVGIWTTNSVVHGVGFIAAMLITFMFGKNQFSAVGAAPWYSLLGGVFGVCIVASVVYAITRQGVGFTVTALVVAQVVAAIVMDHYGWLGNTVVSLDWKRGLGICLLIIGALLIKK